MRGTMLWFAEKKDHGFILTDEGERLYVGRDGFVGGAPVGRCANLPVELNIVERDGKRIAVDVTLVNDDPKPRARRRTSSVRSSWS